MVFYVFNENFFNHFGEKNLKGSFESIVYFVRVHTILYNFSKF